MLIHKRITRAPMALLFLAIVMSGFAGKIHKKGYGL